jgi:hypothetical protein
MTDEEFEDAYREALFGLDETGHSTQPPKTVDGQRTCMVDNRPLTDYQVLELWWGKDITEQIRHGRGSAPRRSKRASNWQQ